MGFVRGRIFVGVYAASGAAALIYEVVWTRLLALQMGHTVAAASTVLAAFMGGLAAGAWAAPRLPSIVRTYHILRLYAACEIVVASIAIALPHLLSSAVPALAWAYADGAAPVRLAVVRSAISFVLVALPAVAMGATYPIAAAAMARGHATNADGAATAGLLYAGNTAGAAIGAVAAGFWLIPAFGLRATTFVAVALNIAAAAAAWQLANAEAKTNAGAAPAVHAPARPEGRARAQMRPKERVGPGRPGIASYAAALSGFVALVYEVAWTRLLAMVIGPTTYAFATMAAAFVAGIAVGSAGGTRIARRTRVPGAWLAAMLAVTAVGASGSAWYAASRLPLIVAAEVADPAASLGPIVFRQAALVLLLLAPMTLALGAAFPLALALAADPDRPIERIAARVYAWNTAGAIAGALTGGFLFVPLLGLEGTIRAVASAGLILGAATVAVGSTRRSTFDTTRGRVGLALASVALGGLMIVVRIPHWDRGLLSSGAYKYAPYVQGADVADLLRAGHLIYYKEGAAATVSVRQLAGTMSLAIDGKVDASNGADMLTQRLLAILPMTLHRRPRDVCIIGLGSGVTLDSALAFGSASRVDVVEISPEVVEASRFFSRENHDALGASSVRLIVGDGRSHLLLTSRKYDVIVSEPSNPWMAGVATLFTREFFEAARAHLSPDGVLCQWAHTYDIRDADLRSIVGTFGSVFPESTLWLVGGGDLLLIGTNGRQIDEHLSGLATAWNRGRVPAALADVGIRNAAPAVLASLFAGGPQQVAAYGADAEIQTDDRTSLEYSAPRGIYGRSGSENAATIRQLNSNAPPSAVASLLDPSDAGAWSARGAAALRADAYEVAYDAFRHAVTLDPHRATDLRGLSDAAAGAHRQDEERRWLESLAAGQPGNAAVRVELSRLYAATGDLERAAATAEDAVRSAPADPVPAEQLASVYSDAGDAQRLLDLSQMLMRKYPERVEARYYYAAALFMAGRAPEAADAVRAVIAVNPRHARAQNLLGAACATSGRRDCARTAFLASLEADPRDPSTYLNLGQLLIDSGDVDGATEYLAEALALDPTNAAAREALEKVRR